MIFIKIRKNYKYLNFFFARIASILIGIPIEILLWQFPNLFKCSIAGDLFLKYGDNIVIHII